MDAFHCNMSEYFHIHEFYRVIRTTDIPENGLIHANTMQHKNYIFFIPSAIKLNGFDLFVKAIICYVYEIIS